MRALRLAIMLFTRDLRLRDNPALDTAIRGAGSVVPLFGAGDLSSYAQTRQRALAKACERARLHLTLCPGVTVVPQGAAGQDARYSVKDYDH
jgi:deoxyribodipyrimidine photo-lyase